MSKIGKISVLSMIAAACLLVTAACSPPTGSSNQVDDPKTDPDDPDGNALLNPAPERNLPAGLHVDASPRLA